MTSALTQWSARFFLVLAGTALIAGCSTTGQDNADAPGEAAGATCAPELAEIDFGIISTESQANLKTQWEPFLAAMEAELGRPINGFYATDYAGVIEAMGAGKIQLAWYGGKSYIEAAARSDAEAFAQTVNSDGTKGYYSHLITNKDNPILENVDVEAGDGDQYVIKNAADLTFAFNDPNSTSGFVVPSYYVFAKNGINPNEAFEELLFAGSHEATAQAIANQQVDVATNNSENLLKLEQGDPEAFGNIQIIWTSPVIPSDPVAYRNDLPDCLKDQFKDFFYNYKDAAVLEPLGWQGFDQATDADWDTIRELDLGQKMMEVQNDANLSPEAKQSQLDELNKQLEAL
ncbi:phosphonate ABC transporter substrate-binding protein [Phormidium tenue]|uniref:Phosphonate ABC transporter substrate-binding protein n=1 Tax=Phormidium tenue NIES-30 TaxID=549789 RepID=A0A1U7IZX9_9CYAN|nr:phosphonate ABC transporter substrate-binding protein [Phormidium tenue]MBD2231662.1 phosphonate ABC transporter substrate-binding protein [Phormidium tenue FACHB-1052]OKH44835.1 phosphonate ABC transporter substrate-binding protein [Phormidium tenue NIES-30]